MNSKELIKGCGKNIDWEVFGNTPIGEYICGEDGEICPICETKQSERLNCYKEELKKFEKIKLFFDKLYYPQYVIQDIPHVVTTEKFFVDKSVEEDTFIQIDEIYDIISNLKQEIKILKDVRR